VVELTPKVDVMWRTLKMMTLNPPRVVAIGRVYPGGSTIHIVSMQRDFSRVVFKKVRDASAVIPMPILEVNTMGEALGTFIA